MRKVRLTCFLKAASSSSIFSQKHSSPFQTRRTCKYFVADIHVIEIIRIIVHSPWTNEHPRKTIVRDSATSRVFLCMSLFWCGL